MRMVRRNKQTMKYALYLGSVYVVQTDAKGNPQYYDDKNEGKIYMVTGEKKEIYSTPVEFRANFSMSGDEAQSQEYGLDISQYDGIAVYTIGEYPIKEGTIIWKDSEVEYEEGESYFTSDMKSLIEVQSPVKSSADYVCKKISDSLSYTRAIFTAIQK